MCLRRGPTLSISTALATSTGGRLPDFSVVTGRFARLGRQTRRHAVARNWKRYAEVRLKCLKMAAMSDGRRGGSGL